MAKILDYAEAAYPLTGDEVIALVDDPAGSPVTKRARVDKLPMLSGYYQTLVKAADTSRASNNTLTADPDLLIALLANTAYEFEFGLYVHTTTSPDWKHQLYAPAGASIIDWINGATASAINTDSGSALESGVRDETTVYVNTGITHAYMVIKGTVRNGATAGNFGVNWAQNTSNATPTIVKAGSYLKIRRATA